MQARFASALDQILELTVLLNDDMARDLKRRGLTLSRVHVLWLVHHHGPMTQRALADAIDVSPRNITGLVDGLAHTGFITREPHPSDRRATLVTLTNRGTVTALNLEKEHEQFARMLFGDMPEHLLDGFTTGLDHVLTALRKATAST
jgi:DNA-binding MarR family transcriptional regulator